MAFADWVTNWNTSGASVLSASVSAASELIGTYTWFMGLTDVTTADMLGQFSYYDGNYPQGLLKGGFRSLVKINMSGVDDNNLTDTGAFFCFLCNDLDPPNNSTSFYLAGLTFATDGAGMVRPIVLRFDSNTFLTTSDIDIGSTAALADDASSIALTEGDHIPMQVTWDYDDRRWGGTRITFSVGDVGDNDFSNLTTVYDLVDPTQAITTSVIEGLAFIKLDGTPNHPMGDVIHWDSTTILNIT